MSPLQLQMPVACVLGRGEGVFVVVERGLDGVGSRVLLSCLSFYRLYHILVYLRVLIVLSLVCV